LKYNPNATDVVGSTVDLIKGTGSTLLLPQYKNVTFSEIQKQDISWVHEFKQKLFNNYGNTKEYQYLMRCSIFIFMHTDIPKSSWCLNYIRNEIYLLYK
jgi:hypothetical protein